MGQSEDRHASNSTEIKRKNTPNHQRLIPPRGDYQTLLSFQKAEVIYDLTFHFAHKHLSKRDRTVDQMIQAARSGKKNLLEGSKAGRTSKETKLKLTNVARASLEELLDDYRDYLRLRGHPEWTKYSREALYVRNLGRRAPQNYDLYREFIETRPPHVVANIALCLIHQANYLIDQQLLHLEEDFLKQGGLRERMTRLRLARRNGPTPSLPHNQSRLQGPVAEVGLLHPECGQVAKASPGPWRLPSPAPRDPTPRPCPDGDQARDGHQGRRGQEVLGD
jgi:four helix bundle suffix protein